MSFRYRLKEGVSSEYVLLLKQLLSKAGSAAQLYTEPLQPAKTMRSCAEPWLQSQPALRTSSTVEQSKAWIAANSYFGKATQDATRSVQQRSGLSSRHKLDLAQGLVNMRTWAVVATQAGRNMSDLEIGRLPKWLQNLARPTYNKPAKFDTSLAWDMYREDYPYYPQKPEVGDRIGILLRAITADRDINDVRYAACMVGTVMLETGYTFRFDKEEDGKGAGHKYGPLYYGRGYCQLTWKENYVKFGKELQIDLEKEPQRALEADVSYRVMSLGMRAGMFRKKKLSDFLSSDGYDYRGSRDIINGDAEHTRKVTSTTTINVADMFDEFCRSWEAILLASRL
jgi:hypothetical protein